MLQQPSEFRVYQKLPLDLNVHSAEVGNLPPDFKDIGLQLQAQRAAATQAFFFDAFSVKATVPSATTPVVAGIQGMYDRPIHAMYNHPIQATYDPLRHHHEQHHSQQQQQRQLQNHRHHQQQQQHYQQHQHPSFMPTAGTLSTGSWQQQQQQESRGSWFSNWQEVFHGFIVGKDGQQERHSMSPSFEQKPFPHQGVIVAPPVASMRATISAGEAQKPYGHIDGSRALDPCPRSNHVDTPLPHRTPGAEKKRDANMVVAPSICTAGVSAISAEVIALPVSTTGAVIIDAETRQPCLDSDGVQLLHLCPPLPSCSKAATTLLPYAAPQPNKVRENGLVSCTDLKNPQLAPPVGGIACKYITQSPSWLPQGWITEVQTRRTGTTAGTRDKYYKDLMSGRRFRSRNEVIHFLQTGKGRLRKRRQKKAIFSSVFGGHHNLLLHQPHSLAQDTKSAPCLVLAPQPIGFLLGPLVNSHPVQTGPNLSSVPVSVTEKVEAPCQSASVEPTTSSMPACMPELKQPIDVRPQKLPVQRKVKTLSPNKCEDKQASRLWQWLHKPVVKTTELPQRQDTENQVRNDGKNVEISAREPQFVRRTAEVCKEIEVAQKTILHVGKELRSTVEKLTEEIQTAQMDLRLEMQATVGSEGALSNVIEAAQRLDSAMGNVNQATENLVMAMGIAVQATQLSSSIAGIGPPVKQPQVAVPSVLCDISMPDVAMVHPAPRGNTTKVVDRSDFVMGNSMLAAKQPQLAVGTEVQEPPGPDVSIVSPPTRGSTTQAVERPNLALGYFMQENQMPNDMMGHDTEAVQLPDLTRGHIAQLEQMPDITMHNKIQGAQMPEGATCNSSMEIQSPLDLISSPWNQAFQRMDAATGIVDLCDPSSLKMEELSRDMHAYQNSVEMSKQIVEARAKHIINNNFAALNSNFDLSMLSPSLSSRQRAKVVQKVKAKHTRGLLVILGRKLCLKALSKAGVRML